MGISISWPLGILKLQLSEREKHTLEREDVCVGETDRQTD